ncbi:hypothetical protein Ancab_026706 [Ancistrocladus abbreviatus]
MVFRVAADLVIMNTFKDLYSNVFEDRTLVFFTCSASTEVIANVAFCPFEAIKVRVQAQPQFGRGLLDGFPKQHALEGLFGVCLSSSGVTSIFYSYYETSSILYKPLGNSEVFSGNCNELLGS